jgi:undecaprenyl diphosphate synthase
MSAAFYRSRVLRKGNLPAHVAIIMDGNGRWARRRGLPRTAGHRAGVKTVKRIVTAAGEAGIKYLTLYTFSEQNWSRPKAEVSAIMQLLYETTKRELNEMAEKNVRLMATGRIESLSPRRRDALLDAIEKTRHNTGIVLNLALSYGGRTEILDACRELARLVKRGKLDPEQLQESDIREHLYTNGLPDPDLLIRTSGEMRLSNFLLWQTAYTELYVTDVLWPDFSEDDFFRAIWEFQNRERRFGKVAGQN